MTDQCSDCAHCHGVEIKVDFDGPGYMEAECDMESVMTDEDCYHSGLQMKAESWEKMMRKGPDGFRPCPICGRKLTMNDIQFYDCEGERIGDLETMHDFEHARDPSNIVAPEDWAYMSEPDRRQASEIYAELLSAVENIAVTCNCGYCMIIDAWGTDFPDEGWVDGLKEKANRRMGE